MNSRLQEDLPGMLFAYTALKGCQIIKNTKMFFGGRVDKMWRVKEGR